MRSDEVNIPNKLFENLMTNTIECLNAAINRNNDALADQYRDELRQCEELVDNLPLDSDDKKMSQVTRLLCGWYDEKDKKNMEVF